MNNLFLSVFSLSIMASFVILCVLLLNKIFRINYSRQWLYIIWIVIAIRLIIPVNISIIDIKETWIINSRGVVVENSIKSTNTVKDLNSLKQSGNLSVGDKQSRSDTMNHKDNSNSSDTVTQEKLFKGNDTRTNDFFFSVLDIITAIWIVGTILFLFYHLGMYYSFRKKISRWSIFVKNNEILDLFHSLCIELDIKRQIKIIVCKQVESPLLIGFIKPCIILPSQDFTREQYYFILKHELIHYKHHDLFYKLILLCASALHWFNPLIHYMVYLANNDMELYCDEKLVAKNNLIFRENYSKLLLQVIAGTTKNNNLLLSTGFGRKNKQLKNRFFQIMNSKPTKKGTCFILGLCCLIVVVGNLTAWFIPTKASSAKMTDIQTSQSNSWSENKKYNTSNQLEKISNILVVGIDGINNNGNSRADSILVVSVNPDTKKICLTSFLRDMYLKIPKHGKGKLSSVYKLGGPNLIKSTLETNFDININNTITVDMEAFEKAINSIGGIEIELSGREAEYLNHTNYISNKKYRNLKEGKQRLNGNQALGYIRVRQVPTVQGEGGDLGRTVRLRSLLLSAIEECSKKDISEITKVLSNVLFPRITTDISHGQMLIYLNTVLQDDLNTDTFSIPVEGSYTTKVQDNMSILDVDLEENIKVLNQMYHK